MLGGIAIGAMWLAPRVAADVVASELRAKGFEHASFRVREVGPTELVLDDVRLGPERAVDEVRVGLDPLRAEVASITLVGARLSIDPSIEALRRSSLARLLEGGDGSQSGPALVRLERAQLALGELEPIELDGEIRPVDGRARLTVRSPLGEHLVRARVQQRDDGTSIAVTAHSSLDRARASVRWSDGGPVVVRATAELGAGVRTSGGHVVSRERASLQASATIDAERVRELDVEASAGALAWGELALRSASVRARLAGEAIEWSAALATKAELDLALRGRAPAELARLREAPIEWDARGPIERGMIEAALPGLLLETDPRVALTGTGRASEGGFRLDDIAGTVAIDGLQVPDGDTALVDARATVRASATIDGPRVSLAFHEGTHVEAAQLDIDELHARAIALSPIVRLRADGARARVELPEPVTASMARLSIGSGSGALHFDRTRMTLAQTGEETALVDTSRAPHVAMRLDARAARVAGLLRGRDARGGGELEVTMREGGADIVLPLEVRAAVLARDDAELTMHAARVSLPLRWDRGRIGSRGAVRAQEMAWRGISVGSTSGSVGITPDAVSLAWRGRATAHDSFRARARFPFDEGSGTVAIDVPRTITGDADPLTRILTSLTDLRITGPIAGELRMRVDAPERGRARLVLEGADVVEIAGAMRAENVHGTLELAHLSPLESVGEHALRWSTLRVGDFVDLERGSAEVAFVRSGHLVISGLDARTAGGRVRAAPFSFDWDAPDVTLALRLDGIDLDRVVRLLSRGRARATGELDGTVAVRVISGEHERRVILGDGRLVARGPGRIRVEGLRAEDFDTTNLDVLLEGSWIEQRVISVLTDFRYERLSLEVDGEGTRHVRARVVGRGHRVPQELDLTLNVRGIQPLLDSALRVWPHGHARAAIEMSSR